MPRIVANSMLFALCLLAINRAEALESSSVKTQHADVTLTSEVNAIEPGKPFRLGLYFKLSEGWHIYWVNPGEAGEPPRLDLTLPEGARGSEIVWPAPMRVSEGPVMTYGYLGEVLLPVTVTVPAGNASFRFDARANWLICRNICVPEEGRFRLDVPVGTASSSRDAPLFAAADRRAPRPSPFVAKIASDGTLSVEGGDISLQSVANAWFFPDKWGAINDAAPQLPTVTAGKLTLALERGQSFDPNSAVTGVLVIKDASDNESFYAISARPDGSAPALRPPMPAESGGAERSAPAGSDHPGVRRGS